MASVFHSKFLLQTFQVGVDIVIAMVLGQIDQDTCSTSAISLSAEATIADSTTWWAPPCRIQQRRSDIFPVSIAEAWPTELAPHSYAIRVTTIRLGVYGFFGDTDDR